MTFERARNEENKKIRLEQIKLAAKKLFDEMPYHQITLSKIGKEINFTRANLYKYVSSKEDIYLYIIIDELNKLVPDLNKHLLKETKLDTKTLAHTWATIFNNHQRSLKLFSILFTIIEQNADLDNLTRFKKELLILYGKMFTIIKHNIPEFTDQDAAKLLDLLFSFSIARYPLCNPSKIQIEATKLSGFDYAFPDFVETFSETIVFIINGIKLSKM